VRILYLLTSLGVGGAEKQVIDLAQRMAARGHTVAIMSLKHVEEEWPVKLPVVRLNLLKTPMGIWRGLRFAKSFLSIFRADLIHSHTFPANMFARMLRADGFSGPVINTIHNVYEGGWHRTLLYRATEPLVRTVSAVSAAAAQRSVRVGAVSARKMSVLSNGIDTTHFTSDKKRRRTLRSLMQTGSDFVWIAVGRLAPAKDYPNLLRAFALVREIHPDAQLWIVGEGENSIIDTSASGVRWLGLRRDVVDLLDASDGFVMSSEWEGMPLAIGEAMAMEKTVVATDVGGIRELVGEAGLIVPPRDSAALADAMLKVMTMDEWQRGVMRRDAREQIVRQYSMDARAMDWEEMYARLLPPGQA